MENIIFLKPNICFNQTAVISTLLMDNTIHLIIVCKNMFYKMTFKLKKWISRTNNNNVFSNILLHNASINIYLCIYVAWTMDIIKRFNIYQLLNKIVTKLSVQ